MPRARRPRCSSRHPTSSARTRRLDREERAKAICATCPVREPCLEYALRIREPHGIWGGLNESERQPLAHALTAPPDRSLTRSATLARHAETTAGYGVAGGQRPRRIGRRRPGPGCLASPRSPTRSHRLEAHLRRRSAGGLRRDRARACPCCSCTAGPSATTRTSASQPHRRPGLPGLRAGPAGFGGTADLPPARGLPRRLRTVGPSGSCEAVDVDEPVFVVGHSFGGGVAIRLAHDHPDARPLPGAGQLGRRLDVEAGRSGSGRWPSGRCGTGACTSRATCGRCARPPGSCPVILGGRRPQPGAQPRRCGKVANLARSADLDPSWRS